jgi:hypothetical protein
MRTLPLPLALLLLLPFSRFTRAAINWDAYTHPVVPSFKWSRSFPEDGTDPGGFDVNCRASGTFHAKMYKLKDLPDSPPTGLAPWHEAIEHFLSKRDYMGSWDGVDHTGLERELVVMEWVDVPERVREWIEEQQRDEREDREERWLFGVFEKPKAEGEKVHGTVGPRRTGVFVQGEGEKEKEQEQVKDVPDKDKIAVFPAGAMYEILPLWVAKGSGCERETSTRCLL